MLGKYGSQLVDGHEYHAHHPGNSPYCHFCNKHVHASVLLTVVDGNPRRCCRDCLESRPEIVSDAELRARLVYGFSQLKESDS